MPNVLIQLVPCLADNYCALVHNADTGETAAIDVPDAKPVIATLSERGWPLSRIFITHHHNDHTGGVQALKGHYGCAATGPEAEADRIPSLTSTVAEGSAINFSGLQVRVLGCPGHTLGHASYYWPELAAVFTGDTLFSLGCGRIFEGTPEQMWSSLQKLAALPDETKVYCGHEYTLANGRFALNIEPENEALKLRMQEVQALRAAGTPTLPTTIGTEKATNPFLRPHSAAIRARLGMERAPDWQVFARLRELKNKA